MPALHQRLRRRVLDAKLARALEKPVHRRAVEPAGPPEAVGLRDAREQLEVHFLRQAAERAIGYRRRRLPEHARLEMVRDDAQDLRADVVAVDRVDVQAIEDRGGRGDASLLVIDRADPSVDERRRRRLAEVVADGAEHHRRSARARSRSSMRVRAWSITISVCTQTSPSGCHSGSCGQPTSALISGKRRSTTPRSSASPNPIDGRAGRSSSFSISPQIRSGGRSSSAMLPAEIPCGVVQAEARSARRTAPRAARAGCRRRRSGHRRLAARGPRDRLDRRRDR